MENIFCVNCNKEVNAILTNGKEIYQVEITF